MEGAPRWGAAHEKTAHAGLGTTEADWDSSVKHLVATLDRFKVPAKEKQEVLSAISGFKPDIVSSKVARETVRHQSAPRDASHHLDCGAHVARSYARTSPGEEL